MSLSAQWVFVILHADDVKKTDPSSGALTATGHVQDTDHSSQSVFVQRYHDDAIRAAQEIPGDNTSSLKLMKMTRLLSNEQPAGVRGGRRSSVWLSPWWGVRGSHRSWVWLSPWWGVKGVLEAGCGWVYDKGWEGVIEAGCGWVHDEGARGSHSSCVWLSPWWGVRRSHRSWVWLMGERES